MAMPISMLGLNNPKQPKIPQPVLQNPQVQPGQVPPMQQPQPGVSLTPPAQQNSMLGLTPPTVPTTTPGQQLDTTPDAGAKINGGNYYDQKAIDTERQYFDLWNNDQFSRDTAALEQQLRNRGLKPTDPGYATELQKLRETQGKLRESSNLSAIQSGQKHAADLQGMDINAETSNLNRQLGVSSDTRAETELRRDAQRYNNDQTAGYIGQGLQLLDKTGVLDKVGGSLLGLADKGVDAVSGLVNKATGGLTTGLGTKIGGLLGLGGAAPAATTAIGAGSGTLAATLAAGGPAAADAALAASLAPVAAPAAAGGSGLLATLTAAAPWVAAAVAVGAVVANNMPKSSPMNNYDVGTGGWTKPENWGGESYPPESLNRVFGPALQVFSQTGDIHQALAAIGQPQNDLEKHMLERGILHLFSGTGNPMRQIADKMGFGKGAWTAGSDEKKALLNELGIKQ